MSININIQDIQLASGGHTGNTLDPTNPDGCEMCAMEWFNACRALAAGSLHPKVTDARPDDVSPVLHRLGIALNDKLDDDDRQKLKPFLPAGPGQPSLLDATSDGRDHIRRWMALDWVARSALPLWLDAAGQDGRAAALRALAPVVGDATAAAARQLLREVGNTMRDLRHAHWAKLRADVEAQVKRRLADLGTVADAAAVADAVADADAAADADAVADAAADAAATYGDRWYQIRRAAYGAAYPAIKTRIAQTYAPIIEQINAGALDLYARMIRPAGDAR